MPFATLSFRDLADELELEISNLEPGTRIASEHELAATHSISRLTARAALNELERRQLVRREQGRGTFVARRIEYRIGPSLAPSWSRSMRLAGLEPSTQTRSLRRVRARASVLERLGLDPGDGVLRLSRVRYVDEQPVAWAETFLVEELVPDLRRALPRDGSLHETLVAAYGIDPGRAWTIAELEIAPREVTERLGLRARETMLRIYGRTDCRQLERPVELTTTWMRADLFRIVFEFGERS